MADPLPTEPVTAWQHAAAYEDFIGRWSRAVAPVFLRWLGVPPRRRWLDVGTGTGAVAAAIVATCSPAEVTGVDPSDGFLDAARRAFGAQGTGDAGHARVPAFLSGQADALPLPDGAVDAVVSGLVLNFLPDPARALREMARVVAPGGVAAAYVWDYAEGMQLLRHFWSAAVEVDGAAAALDEGVRFPLCRPDALRALWVAGGLQDVAVVPVVVPVAFSDAHAAWAPFLGGQGPAPGHVAALSPAARDRLAHAFRRRLPVGPDGTVALTARAWAVRGRF